MILLYMSNGDCTELPEAVSARKEDETIVCFDKGGRVVGRFPTAEVEAFSADPETIEAIKDEVCKDLTVVTREGNADQLSSST
jgi:hypothetical protein